MTQAEATTQGRYAPPQAHVDDIPPPPTDGPALAGRWMRFWAAMIDSGIGLAILGLVSWLTPWNVWQAGSRPMAIVMAVNLAIGFTAFLVIHGWLLVNRGQTVGKAALRLRIVRVDGGPATAWRLLGVRYGANILVSVIPFVGSIYALVDVLFIFRASRRCLHDLLAGTMVVRA